MQKNGLLLLMTLFFCWIAGEDSRADGGVPAVDWKNRVTVRIADPSYNADDHCIYFNLYIKRTSEGWNNQDTILGDMDLYFRYNPLAFSPTEAISIGRHNEAIEVGMGSECLLLMDIKYHAGRMLVNTRLNTPGGKKVPLPYMEDVFLCQVKMKMSDDSYNPGVVWDEVATGVMTAGGNPVLAGFEGDVDKHPDPRLRLDVLTTSPVLTCEGEDLMLCVEGYSSGNHMNFTWKDSIKDQAPHTVGTFTGPATGVFKDCTYEIKGIGDTLIIHNVSKQVDRLIFSCILQDDDLPGISRRGDIVVDLRDSLYGFFRGGEAISENTDTVNKCAGVAAMVKFYVFGPTIDELFNDYDRIYVRYAYMDEALNIGYDTLYLNTGGAGVDVTSDGKYLRFDADVEHAGSVWVDKMWTEQCSNGGAYPSYDTIYLKEGEGAITAKLAALTISVSSTELLTVDAIPDAVVTMKNPTADQYTSALGKIGSKYIDGKKQSSYTAGATGGADTVIYTYNAGSCQMTAEREILIKDNAYVAIKVLLQGPYKAQDEMYCVPENIYNLDSKLWFLSPHKDNLKVAKLPILTEEGKTICDWIYIKLRDGDMGPIVSEQSVFVRNDGILCDTLGNPYITFQNLPKNSYYVIIEHRNHLAIITSEAVSLSAIVPSSSAIFDMSLPSNVYGNNALKLITKTGQYTMFSGDINGDGLISKADVALIKNNMKLGYNYDINHDGVISAQDASMMKTNINKMQQIK